MGTIEWDDSQWPLAYLITFRTYGTWLHGDERYSIDRHGKNIYGAPCIERKTGQGNGIATRLCGIPA